MSLARAFTKKRAKKDAPESLGRSITTKDHGNVRKKISSPLELLSTTNMLSYNAPDIHAAVTPISTTSTSPSSDASSDSDHKSISSTSTPPSSPDSEKGERVPKPNHLSCYFNAAAPSSSLSSAKSTPNLSDTSVPEIPSRAPSHTKRSHESFHKKTSSSKGGSLSHKGSAPAMGTARTSMQIFESFRGAQAHAQSISSITSSRSNSGSAQSSRKPSFNEPHRQLQQQSQIPLPSSSSTTTPIMEVTAPSSRAASTTTTTSPPPPTPNINALERLPPRTRPPMQGLPSRPNKITPPMQSRSRSVTRSTSNTNQLPPPTPNPAEAPKSAFSSYSPGSGSLSHPFGNELAQVSELAEEYLRTGQEAEELEDARVMAEKGLCRFGGDAYLLEIRELFVTAFGVAEMGMPRAAEWI